MILNQVLVDAPYFGPVQIISLLCKNCGAKMNDFYVVEEQEPRRFTLRVSRKDQLNCRVLKSATGSVRIPEFNFASQPGIVASALITNVEGILLQVDDTISTLKKWEPTKRLQLEALSRKLQRALIGECPFTLIIEDPVGQSGIIPVSAEDDLVIEPLTPSKKSIN